MARPDCLIYFQTAFAPNVETLDAAQPKTFQDAVTRALGLVTGAVTRHYITRVRIVRIADDTTCLEWREGHLVFPTTAHAEATDASAVEREAVTKLVSLFKTAFAVRGN